MSHEIFGNRFASLGKPAWHALGTVYEQRISAQEAFSHMGGYDVTLQPLYTPVAWPGGQEMPAAHGVALGKQTLAQLGQLQQVPGFAIYREAVPDDPKRRFFGYAGPEYHLLTPLQVCTLWDAKVKAPLETMGVLFKGAVMFFTVRLPEIDVKGDEVEMYMALINPYRGGVAYKLMVTGVRVVCRNTMVAGEAAATAYWKIRHDAGAAESLGLWLESIEATATRKANALRQVFEIFAKTKVSKAMATDVFEQAYPAPRQPDEYTPRKLVDAQAERLAGNAARMETRRVAAMELFQGRMTGYSQACKGTAWGAYQAVCELEDCRAGHSERTKAEAAWVGDRAAAKARTYSALAEVCKLPTPSRN